MEWKENLSTETVSRFVELISIIYLRVFLFQSTFFSFHAHSDTVIKNRFCDRVWGPNVER